MTAREVLDQCGLVVDTDNTVSRHPTFYSNAARLIVLYEELIARQQAEISRLRQRLWECGDC